MSEKKTESPGMIYVIHKTGSDSYKIGFCQSNLFQRLKMLQTGSDTELLPVALFEGDRDLEQAAHRVLEKYRTGGGREWFRLTNGLASLPQELTAAPKLSLDLFLEKGRESQRRYRQENSDKHRESKRRHYQKNPDKMREKYRRYRQENPDKVRENHRRYRQKNAEKIRRYRQENADKRREYSRRYWQENGGQLNARRRSLNTRRPAIPAASQLTFI